MCLYKKKEKGERKSGQMATSPPVSPSPQQLPQPPPLQLNLNPIRLFFPCQDRLYLITLDDTTTIKNYKQLQTGVFSRRATRQKELTILKYAEFQEKFLKEVADALEFFTTDLLYIQQLLTAATHAVSLWHQNAQKYRYATGDFVSFADAAHSAFLETSADPKDIHVIHIYMCSMALLVSMLV